MLKSIGSSNKSNRDVWLGQKLGSLSPGLRILDAGAGETQYKKYCVHLEYVAQDFAQYDGIGDGAGKQTGVWDNSLIDIISDITSIPVEDSSFDAILCTEVLEHIPAPIEAIKEFSRVLKHNGLLILTAPFNSLVHFSPYYYYSGFSLYFYRTTLERYGFAIEELRPNGSYLALLSQEILRFPAVLTERAKLPTVLKKFTKLLCRLLSLPVLTLLNLGEVVTQGRSNDLACFEYLVYARKK